MTLELLDILVCPDCRGALTLTHTAPESVGDITEGALHCGPCRHQYPIIDGIPRFVAGHAADTSFGLQWNRFRQEQLDSSIAGELSSKRLLSETGWEPTSLKGQRVLEVGCGAGRFLEVVSSFDCDVVGVDVSSAINAAAKTVWARSNVQLVQADVYKLPFRSGVFDACYCIGVAQHTPDPLRALQALPRLLRPAGRLAVTVYERNPWTFLNGKYLLRPLTKRMNKHLLLAGIQWSMPLLFPLTEVLFRLPLLGRVFSFVLPVANYVHLSDLSWRQRYRLALLDTFDRLAPDFDSPLTEPELREVFTAEGVQGLRRLPNPGVNMIGSART